MRNTIGFLIVSAIVSTGAWAQPVTVGYELHVNTYTTSHQGSPKVALTGTGRFVLVWQSDAQDGSGDGVFARRFNNTGAPLDPNEFRVNTFTTGNQNDPSIAMTGSGDFVVVWTSIGQDGSDKGIFARRFTSAGVPIDAQEFPVNTFTTSAQSYPAVATDASGDFVVVWQSDGQDGAGLGVFGRRFDSTGAPLDVEEFQVNTFTTSTQYRPSVAVGSSGDFAVVWASNGQDGAGFGVFGRIYDSAGNPLDPQEFQVNTFTTGSEYHPVVASEGDGNFVVAWDGTMQDGSYTGVFARRFDSNGTPIDVHDFRVNSYVTFFQSHPSIAAKSSGGFVVVWDDSLLDGSQAGVFGKRFDSMGSPVDAAEFRINTFTTSSQFNSSIAMIDPGTFIVSWESVHQEPPTPGSAGVFAQRYSCAAGEPFCETPNIFITSPLQGGTLSCLDPKSIRPSFFWNPAAYDRFQVVFSTDPAFPKGSVVTSGGLTLRTTSWTAASKKWKAACRLAFGSGALVPTLYAKVVGKDLAAGKSDPNRIGQSPVVQVFLTP
jgi:hypothetical protein